jgi:transcriptional regulator with XRE-family HTH domain
MSPKQLRDALDKLGITKEELANAIKIDEKTVRRWLRGQNKVPHSVVKLLVGCRLMQDIDDMARK